MEMSHLFSLKYLENCCEIWFKSAVYMYNERVGNTIRTIAKKLMAIPFVFLDDVEDLYDDIVDKLSDEVTNLCL